MDTKERGAILRGAAASAYLSGTHPGNQDRHPLEGHRMSMILPHIPISRVLPRHVIRAINHAKFDDHDTLSLTPFNEDSIREHAIAAP